MMFSRILTSKQIENLRIDEKDKYSNWWFSNSVITKSSGRTLKIIFIPANQLTINKLRKINGWNFNWNREFQIKSRNVEVLTLKKNNSIILGLISYEILEDHLHVHLVESSPENIGKNKKYIGIGSNLFAYACWISKNNGFEGNISFFSKTRLIKHYQLTLCAINLGKGKMIIHEYQSEFLIDKYFSDEAK